MPILSKIMIWRNDLSLQYQNYQAEIKEAIARVLASGHYILASEVVSFEKEFAQYLGAKYAVGVASGTDALRLSLMALGIGHGDQVITTPFTAIATVAAITQTGAVPVFVDIAPDTFLIDLAKVAQKITSRTKAVIPVHLFGNVVDIGNLRKIIGRGIKIIEDACQAAGSRLDGLAAGSIGDAAAFSFYPSKNLGGYGDGGMVVSSNRQLAEKVRLLRNYGLKDKDQAVISGVNSRLDEIQAAVLRVKLKYLDKMNRQRNLIAQKYRQKLRASFFEHQKIPDNVYSNYNVFTSRFARDRQKLIDYLARGGIQTNIYYPVPVHLQKAYRFLGYKKSDFPQSEQLAAQIIALPMYAELPDNVQKIVIAKINKYKV